MSRSHYVLPIVLLSVIQLCGGEAAGQRASSPQAKSAPGSRTGRIALLVGVSLHKVNQEGPPEERNRVIKDLDGCVNDVEQMKQLLTGKFEFEEQDILVLPNEQATRAAIIKGFEEHLIRNAKDKIVVFHFSGHGSQMDDPSGDEDDLLDETIVPYDSRTPGVFDISDDELNGLVGQLSAVAKGVTVVLDCCHSGTGTRGYDGGRQAPRDQRKPPPEPAFARADSRGGSTGTKRMEVQNCTVISGCRSDERSYEYEDPQDVWHGALTYFLAREIESAGRGVTYRDVMDQVQAKVTAVKPHQHPVLSGAQAENFVFGAAASLAKPFVLASPGEGNVILQVGQAQGVTAGSIYQIFPPGTKEFEDANAVIATVEITKALPFRSDAKLIEGKTIPTSSRAVEVQHQYGERRIPVYFDNPQKLAAATEIRRLVGSSERIEPSNARSPAFTDVFSVVDEPQKAQLFVRQDGTGASPAAVTILTGDGMPLSGGIAADGPGAARLTAEQLAKWAKWYRTLMIENEHSALKVDLKIEPANRPAGGESGDEIGGPLRLVNGEGVRITIDNKSSSAIYIALLDFSSDGSITVIYPPAGASQPIPVSEGKPWIRESKTTLPPGREMVRDYVKLFATQVPVDFGFLRQGAILGERGNNDPLTRLLAGSQLMSRDPGGVRISTNNWTTRLKCLETTRGGK